MQYVDKIVIFIKELDRKRFQQYTIIFLAGIGLVVGGVMYYFYQKSSVLIGDIQKIQKLSREATAIIEKNKKMVAEEYRLQKILERKKGFSIKGFFETFTQKNNITPETGWDTQSREINEKFGEIVLPASFRGYTMQKLVEVLTELDKEEIIYIKELTIRSAEDKKIDFDIAIATKQYKNGFE